MDSMTSRLARAALLLAAACAATTASAQSVFDPYQPESSMYYNYTVPTMPVNPALPNAAREMAAYDSIEGMGGGSRYNTFSRYLDETDPFAPRRRYTGAGVSYSDASRSLDTSRDRSYVPNRMADQLFFEKETRRAKVEAERQKLYKRMIRENDQAKRAQIYREIVRLSDPRSDLPANPGRDATARDTRDTRKSAASSRPPALGPVYPIDEPTPLPRLRRAPAAASETTPAAGASSRTSERSTGERPATRSRRPPSTSELLDSLERPQPVSPAAPASTAPKPPRGNSTSPPPIPPPDGAGDP
jgi:hypothetical protein